MSETISGQPQQAFAQGFSLGRYEIAAVRGYSEIGVEYSAHDRETGIKVAIQEFLPGSISVRKGPCTVEPTVPQNAAQFALMLDAFLEEAGALALCKCPGINAIRDAFRSNGTGYVVAECPPGESLDGILEREGIIGGEALDVMLPTLLDGLGKLHEAGLLHLDIRPENIVLQDTGAAILRGFGAAPMSLGSARQSFGETRWKRQILSVPSVYAPIELYSENTSPGPWSDIYSMGAVLYRCITGSVPAPVTDRVLEDSLVLASNSNAAGVDSKTLSAIKAATAIVPSARPRSVAMLRSQLYGQAPTRARAQFARTAARGGRLSSNAGAIQRAGGNANPRSGSQKWIVPAMALTAATALVAFIDVGVLRPDQDSVNTEPSLVHLAMAGRTEAMTYSPAPSDAAVGEPQSSGAGSAPAIAEAAEAVAAAEAVPVNEVPASAGTGAADEALSAAEAPPVDEAVAIAEAGVNDEALAAAGGDAAEAPPAAAPAGATLVVETVPPNVEVLVAGRSVGYTPLQLPGLSEGIHDITLRHPHYETMELAGQQFVVAEELRIETTLQRGAGNLLVTTDPPGAWVEINGDRVLERTPGTLRQLPAGPVEIMLGAPGHVVTRVAADVPRGGMGYLARILPVAYGRLEVVLEPADAQVVVSNDADIAYSYNPGMRLPHGSYRLEVSKRGYREVARTVNIDGETSIRIELQPRS